MNAKIGFGFMVTFLGLAGIKMIMLNKILAGKNKINMFSS